ncbi:MAG TPA: hypothetical protein VHH32_13255 [Gemmatimonadales bacterium]|nr:hypothetical protein [Gemmatimonadales bacterium]
MARFPVHQYALIGGLLGLLSTLRSVVLYSLSPSRPPLPGATTAQVAWGLLRQALPEIVVCALVGAVVGILVSRGIIARFRVHHYALIGALFGLLPTIRTAIFYSLYITHDPSWGFTQAQFAWAMLQRALPEILVCAVLGAVVGVSVRRRRRSTHLAAAGSDSLGGASEQWLADRRSFLLISGLAITTLLLWTSPRLLLYPSLGVGIAWVITRVAGWRSAGGILLLGGLLGSIAHFWLSGLHQAVGLMSYLMRWGALGIIIAVGTSTVQALGPTLVVMGLTSPRPSKSAAV